MLEIAIRCTCTQHSQAMVERGVCELAHSFFHFLKLFFLQGETGAPGDKGDAGSKGDRVNYHPSE